MKKSYLILVLFILQNSLKAQEVSYGALFGTSFYTIANNNGTNTFKTNNHNTLYFGGYGEYNFNEKMGLKAAISFNKKEAVYAPSALYPLEQEYNLSYIEIAPSFKYDFGTTYREGFYVFIGPKAILLTSAKYESDDAKDAFESFNIGSQLGFGYRVFKFVDIEAKLDYELTPFFKLNNGHKSSFFGASVGVSVDLQKILEN